MATKLKGLEVGKVDFVDEGANQRADIKLLKGKNKAEETSDPEIGLFKRFLNWISGEVQKSATTFDEQINAVSMDAIRDEIWSVCYALQNSLNSILCDPELDSSGKQSAMDTSIEQFATAMKEYIPGWAGGTSAKIKKNLDAPDETDLPMVMKAHSNLEEIIQKYPAQETTDPDPVMALNRYIKKLFPECIVFGIDELSEYTIPADTPVFYSGLKSIDSTDGHCRSSLSWFNAVISVHLLCPKPSLRLKMMAALHQSLAKDEEIIMFDDSPMVVKALKMNNNADYLREGQMSLTGYYACLKDAFKQPGISGVTINDLT